MVRGSASWPGICACGFLGESLGDGNAVGRRFPCWGHRVSPGVNIQGRNPSPFGTCDGGAIGVAPFLKASHLDCVVALVSPWTDVLGSRCFRCGSCNVKSGLLREGRGSTTITRGDPPWSLGSTSAGGEAGVHDQKSELLFAMSSLATITGCGRLLRIHRWVACHGKSELHSLLYAWQ